MLVDTTEGMEPPRGIEPRPRPYQGRMLPLSPWRRGASGRIRTGHHRVGGPRSYRWTTLALVRPTGIEAEHGPVSFTGPSTFVSCQRPRSFELVGGKGFEPKRSLGENGFTARQRTIRSYRPNWRQRQDSNPDPRALETRMLPLHHAADVASRLETFEDKTSCDLARDSLRA